MSRPKFMHNGHLRSRVRKRAARQRARRPARRPNELPAMPSSPVNRSGRRTGHLGTGFSNNQLV